MIEATMSTNEIGRFFDELKYKLAIVKRHKLQTDRYLASDFSVFSYILDDENILSDMIADLLRPDGKHGQDNAYLISFLNMLFESNSSNSNLQSNISNFLSLVTHKPEQIKIFREKSTDHIEKNQRRMDIVIDFGEGNGLMIENKPWTIDQYKQLEHYHQNMKLRFKNSVILVYLSGNGNPPSLDSLPPALKLKISQDGEYVEINFPKHIPDWLHHCFLHTDADKIRWFLRDFKNYVETKFHLFN